MRGTRAEYALNNDNGLLRLHLVASLRGSDRVRVIHTRGRRKIHEWLYSIENLEDFRTATLSDNFLIRYLAEAVGESPVSVARVVYNFIDK